MGREMVFRSGCVYLMFLLLIGYIAEIDNKINQPIKNQEFFYHSNILQSLLLFDKQMPYFMSSRSFLPFTLFINLQDFDNYSIDERRFLQNALIFRESKEVELSLYPVSSQYNEQEALTFVLDPLIRNRLYQSQTKKIKNPLLFSKFFVQIKPQDYLLASGMPFEIKCILIINTKQNWESVLEILHVEVGHQLNNIQYDANPKFAKNKDKCQESEQECHMYIEIQEFLDLVFQNEENQTLLLDKLCLISNYVLNALLSRQSNLVDFDLDQVRIALNFRINELNQIYLDNSKFLIDFSSENLNTQDETPEGRPLRFEIKSQKNDFLQRMGFGRVQKIFNNLQLNSYNYQYRAKVVIVQKGYQEDEFQRKLGDRIDIVFLRYEKWLEDQKVYLFESGIALTGTKINLDITKPLTNRIFVDRILAIPYRKKHLLKQSLENLDKKNPYRNKINSTYFVPNQYFFAMDKSEYTQEEQEFMKKPEKGVWLWQKATGYGGFGIEICFNTSYIQNYFRQLKSQSRYNKYYQQLIVQQYIASPLLYEKKQFDFRDYGIILSTSPLVVIMNHGYIRRTAVDYDLFKLEKWYHLVNGYIQEQNPQYDWENRDNQRTVNQFFNNLLTNEQKTEEEIEIIKDRLYALHAYTFMSGQQEVQKRGRAFQIYGLDITFDSNYSPYLIEYNSSPWLIVDPKMIISTPIRRTIEIYTDTVIYATDRILRGQALKNHQLQQVCRGDCQVLINQYQNYNFLDTFQDSEFHPHKNQIFTEQLKIPEWISQHDCLQQRLQTKHHNESLMVEKPPNN